MDEELRTLMRRNLELSRENNKLLKKVRRNLLTANIMRLVWWAIIIGLPVILYYYVLQPYITEIGQLYQGISDGVSGAQEDVTELPFFGELVKKFFSIE